MFHDVFSAFATSTALSGLSVGILRGLIKPDTLLKLGPRSVNMFACALGGAFFGAGIEFTMNKYKDLVSSYIYALNTKSNYQFIKNSDDKMINITYALFKGGLAFTVAGIMCNDKIAYYLTFATILPIYFSLPFFLIGGMIWSTKKGYESFSYIADTIYEKHWHSDQNTTNIDESPKELAPHEPDIIVDY